MPEIDAESTEGRKVVTEDVRGQIRLEDIHFRYPTRPGVRVLRGLTLKVEPGTYIALVGASGSGKSTVYVIIYSSFWWKARGLLVVRIQLIERFYDPLAGEIYVSVIIVKLHFFCPHAHISARQ